MSEKVERHIIVAGGGGFLPDPKNPLLEDYILGVTKKRRPKICFVPTGKGDRPINIRRFYRVFPPRRAVASHLPLFDRTSEDPRRFLLSQDVIYIGGGNTANLLAVWRLHGIDKILREAWRRGVVISGVCAGMLCLFECGVTDSFGPLAALNDGLGWLKGSACPHYDGDEHRRPIYHRLLKAGFPAGYAADDGAALHYIGGRLARCVSSRPKAKVYSVKCVGGRIVETPLPTTYLGALRKRVQSA